MEPLETGMDHFVLLFERGQPIQDHSVHFFQGLALPLTEFGRFSRFDEFVQQVGTAQLANNKGTKSGFFQSGHKPIKMFQHIIVPIPQIDTLEIPQRCHRKLRWLVAFEECFRLSKGHLRIDSSRCIERNIDK